MKNKEESILTLCYVIVGVFIGVGSGTIGFFLGFLPVLGQLITVVVGFFGYSALTMLYLLAVQSRRKGK